VTDGDQADHDIEAVAASSAFGEAALRAAVHRTVATGVDAVVFYELQIPRTYERVDLALIAEDVLHGFELKSERDTLTRLPRQVGAYSRVLDRCSVVVAARHLPRAVAAVPEWWGVTVADQNDQLEAIRPSLPNPGPVDRETLVALLWKRDLAAELSRVGMISGRRTGWDGHTREQMRTWLLEKVGLDDLRAAVRRALVLRAHERGLLLPAPPAVGGGHPVPVARRAPRTTPQVRVRSLRVLARAAHGSALESNTTSDPAAVSSGSATPKIHWLCRVSFCEEGLIEPIPGAPGWYQLTSVGVDYLDRHGFASQVGCPPRGADVLDETHDVGGQRRQDEAVELIGRLFDVAGHNTNGELDADVTTAARVGKGIDPVFTSGPC
jgi:hypothetical protein